MDTCPVDNHKLKNRSYIERFFNFYTLLLYAPLDNELKKSIVPLLKLCGK